MKRNKIKIISTSFHSTKEIKASRRKYQYAFLSPIFDSISKQKYKSNFDLEKLERFLKSNSKNLIALGGINETTIVSAKTLGFSGAASLGYIWKSKEPESKFKKLKLKIK